MSTTGTYKRKIGDKLAYLQTMLERRTDLESYEENHDLEDVICELLNLAYGYKLENLNRETPNHPAVDLGDKDRGICVQVTADNSRGKITRTLELFDQHGLSQTYSRVIVFVLGRRGSFKKEFSAATVSFSPEQDLMDFSTLMERIKICDADTVTKIHDYLEQEYPTTQMDSGWIKKMGRFTVFILLAALLSGIGMWLYEQFAPPEYAYETETDWLTMDEAACVLTAQSKVRMFTKDTWLGEFGSGAALTVLYNNLDEQDRVITEFTVYAENIVEDLTPRMLFNAFSDDYAGIFRYSLYNYGWSETGEITVDFVSLTPDAAYAGDPPAKISLREDAPRSWSLETIRPGGDSDFSLLQPEDFVVEGTVATEDLVYYSLVYELHAPETAVTMTLECSLQVQPDGSLQIYAGGGGAGDETTYVIWVPTSEPTWSHTYEVKQILPGKKTVRLPIFIVPEKSCTMDVRIQFKTLDGEVIEATPLENAEFLIPYYENESEYVDGSMLDWSQVIGDTVVFPFRSTPYVIPD